MKKMYKVDVDSKMMLANILSVCYSIAEKDVNELGIREIAGDKLYIAMKKYEQCKYDVIASHLGKKGLLQIINMRNRIADAVDLTNDFNDPSVIALMQKYDAIPESYSDDLKQDLESLKDEYKDVVEEIAKQYSEMFKKAAEGIKGFVEKH